MRQKPVPQTSSAEKTIKDIRRATRKHYSAEDKIRIVLEGLRGEDSIAAICRREGIAESLYYSWSKEFLEAGKKRLAGDTARSATSDEVKALRRESRDLKEALADVTLENRLLKKSMIGDGGENGDKPTTIPAHRQLPPSAQDAAIARVSGQLLSRYARQKRPLTLRVTDAEQEPDRIAGRRSRTAYGHSGGHGRRTRRHHHSRER
ncbi:Mobile element protein [Ochrobactrum soli]|uniref:Mobile element protein n=1 Tax=Ochrobactrum soli TaxID=2448455 RepID=A0A2P9HF27_9HYPH|nr:Mobile element protein [[Ochrobactrum] soli]